MIFSRFLIPSAVLATVFSANAQIPAFPGAEGYGARARGGRGGDVYIVTNTNASGAGSFRNGIETVPSAGRTIVFAVSGHIHINGLRLVGSKVTIAGQTAPGDGVGLVDGTFRISGDDVVVRHLRFRHRKSGSGGDCVNLDSGSINSVLDSVSMQFSTDENFSSFGSPPENLTMQWSLNAWGLESHSCGGLWDQNHATAHHTLWAHHHTRNPKARPNGLLEWINNVTFDWDIGFIMGDSQTPAPWKANVIGNYFLSPPGNTRSKALQKATVDRNGNPNFSVHLSNNRHDNDGDALIDGTDKGYSIVEGSEFVAGDPPGANRYVKSLTPFSNADAIPVTTDDPVIAFKKVASKAGALRLDIDPAKPLRDEVDTRLIQNLVTQTRNHITRESDLAGVSNGGIGTLNSTAAPVDSDKDGMPDFYEEALGWNRLVQDHNTALPNSGGLITAPTFMPTGTVTGYTRLEEYLHYLAIPHGTVAKNTTEVPTSVQVDLRKFTSGFSASPTFTVGNFTGGSVALSGPGNAIATFAPALNHVGRARFDFTVTDASGVPWTQTCALVIINTSLPRDLLWKGAGSLWDNATPNWLRPATGASVAFSSPDRVTFDQSGLAQPTITVSGSQAPGTVEVNAAGNYNFDTAGSINCLGTLTKRGTGALTLANVHAYFGGTALEEGTINVAAGGNLTGGPVTMLDGTTFANLSPNSITVAAPFDVPAGNAATIKTGPRLNLSGEFTGAGTLNYRVETTVNRADLSNAGAAFAGRLNFTSSGAGGAGVRLFFNGASFNGFDNAHVDVGNSVSLQPQTNSGGNTLNIGALSGGSTGANLSGGTAGAVAYVVGARSADTTFAGSITGNLTFTKVGAGTLTLGGTSTYTGATAVNAGGLLVDGALGNTAVAVASGALLGGDGTLGGSVTASAGAFLSPGTVPFTGATMTVAGGLSLNAATMYCDMQEAPDPATGTNDKITVNGNLTYAGTPYFQFLLLKGSLDAGNYDLVTASGSVVPGGTPGAFPHNLPTGTRQTFTVKRSAAGANPSLIWLEVLGNPATLTWTGATSANWDPTTVNNWTGATPNTFGANDAVIFGDGSTVNTIAIPGAVAPRSVLVNTSARAYSIGGAAITGAGSLTKSGSNTLTLTSANSYGGGTTIHAGSTIFLANETANSGALGTGVTTLNGGTLTMLSNTSGFNGTTLHLYVPTGQTGTFNPDARIDLYGTLSGGGTLNFRVPWIRTSLFGDWSAFTGQINVTTDGFNEPGNTTPNTGEFRMSGNYEFPGFPAAAVSLGDKVVARYEGILAEGAGTTITIGALSGTAASSLLGGPTGGRALTYRIGSRGTDASFAGTIGEQNTGTATNYLKTGVGTWTLGGSGTWNGGTIVEQGTLKLTGAFTCSSATHVHSGATLQFAGGSLTTDALNIATGATFTGHGTLTGDLNNDGTLTVGTGGSLTVTGEVVNNGTMRFTGGSALAADSGFVNNGTLDLLTASGGLPPNMENNGIVIDSSHLRTTSAVKSGNTVTLTAMTYSGHVYQLQRAASLIAPNWQNVGAAKSGNNAVQSFADTAASGSRQFYRLTVIP